MSKDNDPLEEALQKALDKTTPERAGCPWDGEHKPSDYSDEDLEKDLIKGSRPIPVFQGHVPRNYQDES